MLNLRGRIVTMVNMRRLLGLTSSGEAKTAVGIERFGEAFGLIIDEVGEVLVLEASKRETNPPISTRAGPSSSSACTDSPMN